MNVFDVLMDGRIWPVSAAFAAICLPSAAVASIPEIPNRIDLHIGRRRLRHIARADLGHLLTVGIACGMAADRHQVVDTIVANSLLAVAIHAPHEPMLEAFGQEIWLASGPVVSVAGFRYPTRMAVIRLSDGQLFIWSPVALSDALQEAVDALGEVRWLIAPNTLHDLFLSEWQRAYPAAELHAPPGLREQRKDLRFGGDLANGSVTPWSDEIDCVVVDGNWITTEAVFFHVRSRTILFTDLVQQFSPGWFTGWRSVVARLDGMVAIEPRVPRKFRYAFFARDSVRAALRQIVAWPADQMVMAHGSPIQKDAQAVVRRAFRWLLP